MLFYRRPATTKTMTVTRWQENNKVEWLFGSEENTKYNNLVSWERPTTIYSQMPGFIVVETS